MNALTRRDFLKRTSIATSTAALTFPFVGNVLGANDRINLACIGAGTGGKGDGDSNDAAACGGNIVALCDVDLDRLESKAKKFPDAKKYQDYRKLFDEMEKNIDAVTVSTPDHNHGVASIRAMKLGLRVAEIPTREGSRLGGESTAKSLPTGIVTAMSRSRKR